MFGKGIMIQKILVEDISNKYIIATLWGIALIAIIAIVLFHIIKKMQKIKTIVTVISIVSIVITILVAAFYNDYCRFNSSIIGYEFINLNEYINLDYYIKPDSVCVAFLEDNPNIEEFTYNNLYVINKEYTRKIVRSKDMIDYKKLEKICSRKECLRFGQLMNNFTYWLKTQKNKDIFYLTDEEFIYYLEMYTDKIVEV